MKKRSLSLSPNGPAAMTDDTQGDLLAGMKVPATTARILKFASEIADVKTERPDYLHSVLCQVGLPRSKSTELTFVRKNGNASLLVEAGKLWDGSDWVQQPLPYGTRPRLALVHISSEAIRTKSAVVEIGSSVREFLVRLDVDTGGREFIGFKRQMQALSACRMTLGFGLDTIDAKPIKRFTAWLEQKGGKPSQTPGAVELSAEFFQSLSEYAVPLDARALAALKHSSLALDVYAWLAHRLHRVKRHTGERVTWRNMREQFGQEYVELKDFKREIAKALRTVLPVYPDARIEPVAGGVILLPSRAPVSKTVVLLPRKTV